MTNVVALLPRFARHRLSLAGRVTLLALILFCEKFALTFFVNYGTVLSAGTFGSVVRIGQHVGFRFLVTTAIALGVFGYATADREAWSALSAAGAGTPVKGRWIAAHTLLVLLLIPLTFLIYGETTVPASFAGLVVIWALLALGAVLTLCAAFAPFGLWYGAGRMLGRSWLFALAAAAVAVSAMNWSQRLWAQSASITFDLVRRVLTPIIPSLQADPTALLLTSDRFAVHVSPLCSGLEGAGLLLAFCSGWLLCLRREYVFPRALLILPAAVLLSLAVNVLRIATLMLIGYMGYPAVAIYGFHSQAGWIAFNVSAAVIALAAQRSGWLRRPTHTAVLASADVRAAAQSVSPAVANLRDSNATAVYLLPFLGIMGAGMLARALSGGFEILYGLRVVAAALLLIWAWPRLRSLNWHCSWRGLCAGVGVFVVWVIGAHRLTVPEGMPAALAVMGAPARDGWLTLRVLGAVVTVPVAEELAFRGYLMRRLTVTDFESVRFRQTRLAALLLSSLLFGLEEGALWIPGFIAAIVFASLLIRTERMGEAALAHATTNALLAFYVLYWHQWQLW
jgi:exosortase E/protease (VPEID-CTERM system)